MRDDSVKTVNGVARVSVAPLGDKVREYLASVVRDGTRPECDGVQVFWEADDRWGCIRLPSRPALGLASALAAPKKTWYPYGGRPPFVDGYVVRDGNHVFLVGADLDSTADHIDGATVPLWLHKWVPEKMEYASEDTWEAMWTSEVGCMMTLEQAGQVAALIRKRAGMSRCTYMSSRRFLKLCRNKGLPSHKVITDVIVAAGLTVSFPDGIAGQTATCAATDWSSKEPVVAATASGDGTGGKALEGVFLELLDRCPRVITALSIGGMQDAAWPKPTRRM